MESIKKYIKNPVGPYNKSIESIKTFIESSKDRAIQFFDSTVLTLQNFIVRPLPKVMSTLTTLASLFDKISKDNRFDMSSSTHFVASVLTHEDIVTKSKAFFYSSITGSISNFNKNISKTMENFVRNPKVIQLEQRFLQYLGPENSESNIVACDPKATKDDLEIELKKILHLEMHVTDYRDFLSKPLPKFDNQIRGFERSQSFNSKNQQMKQQPPLLRSRSFPGGGSNHKYTRKNKNKNKNLKQIKKRNMNNKKNRFNKSKKLKNNHFYYYFINKISFKLL